MAKKTKKNINISKIKKNKTLRKENIIYPNIVLFILGIFLLGLLLMSNYIIGDSIIEILLSKIAYYTKFMFGKGAIIFSLSLIIVNAIIIYRRKNLTKTFWGKKVAFILAFLSFLMILTINDLKGFEFIELEEKLFSNLLDLKGGGAIGLIPAFVLLKLNVDITSNNIYISNFVLLFICLLLLSLRFIKITYIIIQKNRQYYNSEEYLKKKEILELKKNYEKKLKLDKENKENEEISSIFINIKDNKLNEKIMKRNDGQDEKGLYFTEEELERKRKEWQEYLEREEKLVKFKRENEEKIIDKKEENKEKFIKEEVINIEEEVKEEYFEENIENIEEELIEENLIEEEVFFEKEPLKEELIEEKETVSNINILDREEIKKAVEELFKYRSMDPDKKEKMKLEINSNIELLENTLRQFGVEVKVVDYATGPSITRYELKIMDGKRIKRVTELENEIKMYLKAESLRMEAPIPGKDTIGIETPNKIKEPVYFSNVIHSKALDEGILPVILGKDIVGKDKIIDIAKMPHLLIAGTTGSGKSICINTMISSLISKKTDEEVRFIMIDPKMVELMPYNGIPHLLTPVIIDPNKAAVALKWAVNEMEERYKKLSNLGLKNIETYRQRFKNDKNMPYIVIVIDELADLMMVASNNVETSIARIAQKARAVGIHLIVATQRPSVDVITGMIKANLPSRISFALRSSVDSRTILEQVGAEKLLGKGDMLLLDNGKSKLERLQGAYISDEEVMDLTDILKKQKKVEYNENILVEVEEEMEDKDPLYDMAVKLAKSQGDKGERLSISFIQRELQVGFNRASRICSNLKANAVIDEENKYIYTDF